MYIQITREQKWAFMGNIYKKKRVSFRGGFLGVTGYF